MKKFETTHEMHNDHVNLTIRMVHTVDSDNDWQGVKFLSVRDNDNGCMFYDNDAIKGEFFKVVGNQAIAGKILNFIEILEHGVHFGFDKWYNEIVVI